MTTEETRAFLKTQGVAETLVAIFQAVKYAFNAGEKYVDVILPDEETASQFNQVIVGAGYVSTVYTKDDKTFINIATGL